MSGQGLQQIAPTAEPTDLRESRLSSLIYSSSVLMGALRAARALNAPDWLIGAGAIRDRVWDHLHGFARGASKDVDLAYFDPSALGSAHERELQRAVTERAPDICWEVTNQAAMHLWYPHVFGIELEPLTCSGDAVAMWPETATAVGIRLLEDDSLQVVAPFGLDDLFDLICRRNPRVTTTEQYRRRIVNKRIAKRWPRVRILDPPD